MTDLDVFSPEQLEKYQKDDRLLKLLETRNAGEAFTSHRWLKDSLPKRMIFDAVYGALLDDDVERKRVLDVGGGVTALTPALVRNHEYTLVDIMAHDDHSDVRKLEAELGDNFWVNLDWEGFSPEGRYDWVIANDLFPNVDQRLDAFVEKFAPHSGCLSVTLTYYNQPARLQGCPL